VCGDSVEVHRQDDENQLTAFVVCGGFASRMGVLGKTLNKNTVMHRGRPVLTHLLDVLIDVFHVTNVVLVAGHLSAQVIDAVRDEFRQGVEVEVLTDKLNLGTAMAMSTAIEGRGISRFVYSHGNIILGDVAVQEAKRSYARLGPGDSLLLTSRFPIAETHPRVEVEDGRLSAPSRRPSSQTHFSVGVGLYELDSLPKECVPEATWESVALPRLHGDGYSADIGDDWLHIAQPSDL